MKSEELDGKMDCAESPLFAAEGAGERVTDPNESDCGAVVEVLRKSSRGIALEIRMEFPPRAGRQTYKEVVGKAEDENPLDTANLLSLSWASRIQMAIF